MDRNHLFAGNLQPLRKDAVLCRSVVAAKGFDSWTDERERAMIPRTVPHAPSPAPQGREPSRCGPGALLWAPIPSVSASRSSLRQLLSCRSRQTSDHHALDRDRYLSHERSSVLSER